MQAQPTPHRLCECGCGQTPPLAKYTDRRFGHIKGQPVRFVNGHNARGRTDWVETESGCWEWQGTLSTEGYGVLRIDYAQVKAHRWVYERLRGPIAPDMAIDHLCLNKRCVNPDHLEVVTPAENTRRHWALHRERNR